MEDTDNNVFIGRNDIILTKQVLSNELVDDIMKHISTCEFNSNFTKLATRHILPDDLPSELYDNINNEIITTVSNYHMLEVKNIRCYKQSFGEIKEHTDKSYDGVSNHTLIIYLNDDFDGSELSIKTKLTEKERKEFVNKNYYKFTITPKKGAGILFNKNLIHSSTLIYGTKYSLIVDLHIY